jgi:hypothetical protein
MALPSVHVQLIGPQPALIAEDAAAETGFLDPFTALIPADNLAQRIAVRNWEGLLQFPCSGGGFRALQRQPVSSSGVFA